MQGCFSPSGGAADVHVCLAPILKVSPHVVILQVNLEQVFGRQNDSNSNGTRITVGRTVAWGSLTYYVTQRRWVGGLQNVTVPM